jgi:hypothetical protein
MIIKSNLHSCGKILGAYVDAEKNGEAGPGLYFVHGTPFDDFKLSVEWMDSFKKGTRAKYGLEHIQICPEPGQVMTPADWLTSIEITLTEKKYVNSKGEFRPYAARPHKKIIDGVEVLHMHLIPMRFNLETGMMNSCSNSYRDNDRARAKSEEALGHRKTRQSNPNHPIIQQQLHDLWTRMKDGKAFQKGVEALGYRLAIGGHKRALRVVDGEGIDYDLVRKVRPPYVKGEEKGIGIKAKEVWDRLRGLDLAPYTEVIKSQRARHQERMATEKKRIIEEQKVYSPDSRPPKEAEVVEFDISKKQDAFSKALDQFKEKERLREERERRVKEMMENLEKINAKKKDRDMDLSL